MFTGLVERTGKVLEVLPHSTLNEIFTLRVDPGPSYERDFGASVAVNGVCLTEVGEKPEGVLTFHVSPETLNKTSLGQLKSGDKVNLERAMRPSDRFGGHLVLGHVDGTSKVVELKEGQGFWLLKIEMPPSLSKYIVSKGSITINGVSLTVNAVEDFDQVSQFSFMLIPVTWQTTSLSQLKVGDLVNIEVDILAKHVERLMKFNSSGALTSLFFAVCFLFSSMSFAVTWEAVQKAAVLGNPSLKKSSILVEKSATATEEKKSGYYPSISAKASRSRDFETKPYVSQTSNRVGLTASQNLFSGFSNKASIEQASATYEANLASKKSSSVNERAKLRNLFDKALYLQKSVGFAQRTLARRAENVRIVNLRYEGGRENKSAVLKTEASKLQAETDLQYYQSNFELTRKELSYLSGMNLSPGEVFEGAFNDVKEAEMASSSHPNVEKAVAEANASRAEVVVSRAGWMPQLTADASIFRSGLDARLEPENQYSVGLTLTVPLYTPGQSSRYREAVLNLQSFEQESDLVQKNIELEKEKSKLDLITARSRLNVAKKDLEASQMQAEVYRQRYTLGMVSFQDWDVAEADLFKTDRDLLAAELTLADAGTSYELSIGRILEE